MGWQSPWRLFPRIKNFIKILFLILNFTSFNLVHYQHPHSHSSTIVWSLCLFTCYVSVQGFCSRIKGIFSATSPSDLRYDLTGDFDFNSVALFFDGEIDREYTVAIIAGRQDNRSTQRFFLVLNPHQALNLD